MHLADDHSKRREYWGGALMIALGLGASAQSLSYPRGTLAQMGPGFFPLALGILLSLTGAAIVLAGLSSRDAGPLVPIAPGETPRGSADWRGWACIALGIVAFIVFGTYGGLVPAAFSVVFISALGDRRNTLRSAFALAAVTAAIAVAVFFYGLQLQMPLFRWS